MTTNKIYIDRLAFSLLFPLFTLQSLCHSEHTFSREEGHGKGIINVFHSQEREESNKSRWLHYDLFMLVVHGLSVLLDVYWISVTLLPHWNLPYKQWSESLSLSFNTPLFFFRFGVIRSLRPFIIIKLIRLSLKVKVAKNRIDQLLRWERSHSLYDDEYHSDVPLNK